MFKVIIIMFSGIGVGCLLRRHAFLRKTDRLISGVIILLLFLLGASVGANPMIISNLPTLGGQALLIAAAGIMGSLLCAWIVNKTLLKKKSQK